MAVVADRVVGGERFLSLAFAPPGAAAPTQLELSGPVAVGPPPTPAARHGDGHSYWKIGITLADVDLAAARLAAAGIETTQPAQFEDIGYLCHLRDPDGHAIELLQHRFLANHEPVEADPGLELGSAPTLGQITLRVADADASLGFYRDGLGLTLLSRQPVPRHRFTLFFLAATKDRPPLDDLDAVGNREWLWQRPYTVLELQHRWDRSDTAYAPGRPGAMGFQGIEFAGTDALDRAARLGGQMEGAQRGADPGERERLALNDPDGNRVWVSGES